MKKVVGGLLIIFLLALVSACSLPLQRPPADYEERKDRGIKYHQDRIRRTKIKVDEGKGF